MFSDVSKTEDMIIYTGESASITSLLNGGDKGKTGLKMQKTERRREKRKK
jgi:hypothetical protein